MTLRVLPQHGYRAIKAVDMWAADAGKRQWVKMALGDESVLLQYLKDCSIAHWHLQTRGFPDLH